jgi:hypothetical protein
VAPDSIAAPSSTTETSTTASGATRLDLDFNMGQMAGFTVVAQDQVNIVEQVEIVIIYPGR